MSLFRKLNCARSKSNTNRVVRELQEEIARLKKESEDSPAVPHPAPNDAVQQPAEQVHVVPNGAVQQPTEEVHPASTAAVQQHIEQVHAVPNGAVQQTAEQVHPVCTDVIEQTTKPNLNVLEPLSFLPSDTSILTEANEVAFAESLVQLEKDTNEQTLKDEVVRLNQEIARIEKERDDYKHQAEKKDFYVNRDNESRVALSLEQSSVSKALETTHETEKNLGVVLRTNHDVVQQLLSERKRQASGDSEHHSLPVMRDKESKEESEWNDISLKGQHNTRSEIDLLASPPTDMPSPKGKATGKDLRPTKDQDKELVYDFTTDETNMSSFENDFKPVFDLMGFRCTKIELVDTYLMNKNQIDNFCEFANLAGCLAFGGKADTSADADANASKVVKTLKLRTKPLFCAPKSEDDKALHRIIDKEYHKKSKQGVVPELDTDKVLERIKIVLSPPNALVTQEKVEKTYLPELYRQYVFKKLGEKLEDSFGVVFDLETDNNMHDREATFFEGDVRKFLVTLGRGLDYFDKDSWGPYKPCLRTRVCVFKYK